MSLGGAGAPTAAAATELDALHAAICNSTDAGVTYVVAAGNSGDDFGDAPPDVPAAYPEVLTVTAMADTDGQPAAPAAPDLRHGSRPTTSFADFSNFAAARRRHRPHDRRARRLHPSRPCSAAATRCSGTSMASPHVAGAVALCINDSGVNRPCAGMSPAQIIAKMRADAAAHATAANGFIGDPQHTFAGRFYGFLVRASLAPAAATGAGRRARRDRGLAGRNRRHARCRRQLVVRARRLRPASTTRRRHCRRATRAPDPEPVQGSATGLDPGTTHHYRLAARVDGWTAYGDDKTFTTPGTPPPAAPDTSLDSEPDAQSTTGYAQFTFSASPPANASTGFECRLDTPTWTACSSPFTVDDVGDGAHTFTVRAVGVPGQARRDSRRLLLERRSHTARDEDRGRSHGSDLEHRGHVRDRRERVGSTFECRLDGAAWSTCASVVRFRVLEPGRHRFEARATDTVGLTDASPAAYDWTISGTTVHPNRPRPPHPATEPRTRWRPTRSAPWRLQSPG